MVTKENWDPEAPAIVQTMYVSAGRCKYFEWKNDSECIQKPQCKRDEYLWDKNACNYRVWFGCGKYGKAKYELREAKPADQKLVQLAVPEKKEMVVESTKPKTLQERLGELPRNGERWRLLELD